MPYRQGLLETPGAESDDTIGFAVSAGRVMLGGVSYIPTKPQLGEAAGVSSSSSDASELGQGEIELRRVAAGWLSRFRLPSPAVTITVLVVLLFLLRLPSALLPWELNVDESNMLSQAMKFLIDPRPWIAVDPTSVGPLDAYFIAIFLRIGFKPGYVLVHMLASLLVCLQVVVGYLTVRRFRSQQAAAVAGFLMVLVYGLGTKMDYLHYAGEWLPSLLLMLGFYIFLVWLDQPAEERSGEQLFLLFTAGLVLGTAPWCKLQAGPISGALGLLFLAAVFRKKGLSSEFSWRAKQLTAFCVGAVLTTSVMLAILIKTGALEDFWNSYIRANLVYAGPPSFARSIVNVIVILLVPPINQLLVVGIGLVVLVSLADEKPRFSATQRWALSGVVIYTGAALVAISRVTNLFPHHAIFLVAPMTYLVVDLLPVDGSRLMQDLRSPFKPRAVVLLLVLGSYVAIYTAYAVRYAYMVEGVFNLSHGLPSSTVSTANLVPELGVPKQSVLDLCIGPSHWVFPDSSERMAAVVQNIGKKYRIRSLTIWGWAPGVYVLTGLAPATRDSVITLELKEGPLQKYFRSRLLADLRANPPDLFIDAVSRGTFMWWPQWTEDDGYETIPEVREFIDKDYVLVETLSLKQGAKPVRFFVRREPASPQ